MKKVIFCDINSSMIDDIQTSLMLEDYPFIGMATSDLYDAYGMMDKTPDAEIFIGGSALAHEGFDQSRFAGRTVYGYAADKDEIVAIQKFFPCIGIVKASDKLLETAGMPVISTMKPVGKTRPPVTQNEADAQTPVKHTAPTSHEKMEETPPTFGTNAPVSPAEPVQAQQAEATQGVPGFTPEQMQAMFAMMQQMASGGQQTTPAPQVPPTVQTQPSEENDEPEEEESVAVETGASRLKRRVNERKQQEADKALRSVIETGDKPEGKKTVVVTSYAAKGGVGKTTIASETAVCLALTSNGRRKFRVCIVDYNIDFGDVAAKLKLDEKGNNMVGWASIIDEMIDEGQRPEDISFTRKEMEENYLQQMEGIGLYCLVAPIAHEDSMSISSDALEVMLRNIIDNGGFDYVVCDTGNNTRDGSIVAIDNSDYLMLVATQDVAAANCNAAVLRTIQKTGFDSSKVRMVINDIVPTRECGISVQEVEETFQYPCICRIKRMPDVRKANNLGKPLVLTPSHDYTRQIQKIVAFITSGEVVEEEEKKGLFSGLFKKK